VHSLTRASREAREGVIKSNMENGVTASYDKLASRGKSFVCNTCGGIHKCCS